MRGLIDRRGHKHPSPAGLQQPVAVSRAAWLSEDVLLFTCSAPTGAFERPGATAGIEGRLLALPPSADGDPALPITVCAVHGLGPRPPSGMIAVDAGERLIAVRGRQLLESITDVGTLLREQLAGLDADSRASVVAFLSALPLSFGETAKLSTGLRVARESLRERQPLSAHERDADLAVGVDVICRVDRRRIYVQGWVVDRSVPMLRLTALSPEGERVDLSESAVRYPRTDIAQRTDDAARTGFACTFETRAPSGGAGWVFTVCDARERCVETPELVLVEDGGRATCAIAAVARWDFRERQTLLAQHVEPALTRLQAALGDRVGIASLDTFGTAPDDPAISIVLSLDADEELLEHQLAEVADDTTLRACELICVQDGSRDVERCRWRADQLFDLYGVPFSLAVLTERGGVALGRAAGASVASGPRLLLLDAGVLGVAPGWLSPLARFHAAMPDAGAVTGKLTGPDGAIRHAGFAFERRPKSLEWETTGRFTGLHQSLPAANVTRTVPAVSGACMLVDRARYAAAAAEGWRFVNGGYADRDACLRMSEAGHESWYLPRVTLLHLSLDERTTDEQAYNRWLLHHLWHDRFGATE
jgi:GT2 family glycosyltransferase